MKREHSSKWVLWVSYVVLSVYIIALSGHILYNHNRTPYEFVCTYHAESEQLKPSSLVLEQPLFDDTTLVFYQDYDNLYQCRIVERGIFDNTIMGLDGFVFNPIFENRPTNPSLLYNLYEIEKHNSYLLVGISTKEFETVLCWGNEATIFNIDKKTKLYYCLVSKEEFTDYSSKQQKMVEIVE